jgi:hypothetical protein
LPSAIDCAGLSLPRIVPSLASIAARLPAAAISWLSTSANTALGPPSSSLRQ